MSWLSDCLKRSKMRRRDDALRASIDPKHELRRNLAYYVKHHNFEIGDNSYGFPIIDLFWTTDIKLVVGKYCSIASNVRFFLGGNHHDDHVTTFPLARATGQKTVNEGPFSRGDIIMGSDVWIGTGATIMSGVNIGHGAIVGACSVVASNVPPYAIVAGNPAHVIRKRVSEDHIPQLLDLRWWDFPDEQVKILQPLLQSNDIATFFAVARKMYDGCEAGADQAKVVPMTASRRERA